MADERLTDGEIVTMASSKDRKIRLFRAMFSGRADVYARRWVGREGKSGYSPVCSAEWVRGVCDKKRVACAVCPNRRFAPLDDAAIEAHLRGQDAKGRDCVLGVYPLLPDDTVRFAAIDFDKRSWRTDTASVGRVLHELGLPVVRERSRSGNGAHLWFFFAENESARVVREVLTFALTLAMERNPEIGLNSYDRIFPNQDRLPKGGFGKTVLAAWLISERKVSTLVLVNRRPLQQQWIERLAQFLDLPKKAIGRIGGGAHKPTGRIDVALIQTLTRLEGEFLANAVGGYGQIIVDECHAVSAPSFEKVARAASAKYFLGLSATVVRKDGHHPIIEMQCGPVRHRVEARQMDGFTQFRHVVRVRPTPFVPKTTTVEDEGSVVFADLVAELAANDARNRLIADDVLAAVREGRSPVVISERREHLDALAEMLKGEVRHMIVLRGGMGARRQRELRAELAAIPSDESRLLLATGSFLGEGFDDARLDTLFLTLPISWRGRVTQYAGRLHRQCDGKREVRIYDYVDLRAAMCAKMFNKRCLGYKAIGYEIVYADDPLSGWPKEVELPVALKEDKTFADALRRLTREGVDSETADLFVAAALARGDVRETDAGSAPARDRARSAAERFLFRYLDVLPDTKERFELNARLPIPFGPNPFLEVDLLCSAGRIVVEIDGAFHFVDAENYRRDRRKDYLLQDAGYLVLRFLAEDVTAKLDSVLDVVRRALKRKNMKNIITLSLALVLVMCAHVGLSDVRALCSDWEFRRGDETAWTRVSVPHDWAIAGPFHETNDLQIARIAQDGETVEHRHTGRTGALPWPGKGRYRRRLDIPAGTGHAELVFEGAMSEATVFADGVKVGEWKNGYTAFIVPIPPTTREIEVALDNPPASSRWYPGSGLIRPVRLVTGGKVGIATWGNHIRTVELKPNAAKVAVETQLRGTVASGTVEWTLLAPDGQPVAARAAPVSQGRAEGVLDVATPRLWSPETPTLYALRTELKAAGAVLDARTDRVGIRTARFTREGFFLNGVKRPFRGVCLHHDLGPIGAAFNASAFRRQLRLLRELGVDSIRTSHNMPAPDQLDICDETGFLVMAESFDMWMTPETTNDYARHFRNWWRRDLDNLLRCHRSHPSVVMWSIGNEIHETDAAAVREVAKEMTDICHRMDPTRPVVFVTDRPDAYTASGAIQVTDVPALTYRLPRYGFMHAHSPIGLVLGGETASTFSSRGCYHFPDEVVVDAVHPDGQSSSYDLEHGSWSNLPDDDWAMQDDHPWAIGEFVWTGFDYLGEPTPYKTHWPSRSSYFGLLDLAGLPKDRAWLYRSRWRRDVPTLHVLPHWTWPGREGQVTPVYVYTSHPEAELFVNGVSQGRRRRDPSSRLDRYRLRWREVVYAPGELKVVAYDGHGRAVGEKTVKTAGAPAAVQIVPELPSIVRSRPGAMPELAWFRIRIVDGNGTVCPDADNRIDVSVSGAARFKGICNGDATSLETFVQPTMKAFHGELVVTVEAGTSAGLCRVEVKSGALQPARAEVPVR